VVRLKIRKAMGQDDSPDAYEAKGMNTFSIPFFAGHIFRED